MTSAELVERIWARDATRLDGRRRGEWLGWLDEPWRMREAADLLLEFADSVFDRVDASSCSAWAARRSRPR